MRSSPVNHAGGSIGVCWNCSYTNTQSPIPVIFFLYLNGPNFHHDCSCHMFLLGFLSVPGGALSLTDWKLISTQLTFHRHSGPFYLPTQFKLFSGDTLVSPVLQPHSCTGRQSGKLDGGQDRVSGVLPNRPLHWMCETLHLTQPLGIKLACACVCMLVFAPV